MKRAIFFFFALMPTILSAHSGHGSFEGLSLMHYLESPVHNIPIIALFLLGIIIWKKKGLARE